ncbi:hypothetical protein ACTFIW_007718 [Dictyostelium discoideum]
MNSYIYKEEDWEIVETLKPNVFKVNNKNNIVLNGNSFKTCILKIITNKDKNVWKEGQVLEKLKNIDSIVKCYGWCCDKQTTYIFIEYINGYTLEEYVLKNHPIPEKDLSEIIEDLIQSLASIHEIGVIHRDLKLENVMFDKESNKWKLIDFGLSFSFSPSNGGSKCISICGSKGYCPPEIKLSGKCGRKSDIWIFGCLVIKMLGGELEETEIKIDEASDNKPKIYFPKIPPHASKFLHNFIQKCFEEEEVLRFDSITLIDHPFLSLYKSKGNMLYLIQRGHKRWMDITQKKKGIKIEGKTFTFEDNDNKEPFGLGIVPDGTVELIFKKTFNQPVILGSIPSSVQIIDFGVDGDSLFNQEMDEDLFMDRDLKSMTLGNAFTHTLPYFGSLNYLSLGRNRNALLNLPPTLETLKYYGEVQTDLKTNIIPPVKNLLIPFNNHSIIIGTIPPSVKYLAWGKLKDLEAIETLKNLPPSVNDLTFSCPPDVFDKIQRKHIPDSISIIIINQHVIELKNSDNSETYLKDNIV